MSEIRRKELLAFGRDHGNYFFDHCLLLFLRISAQLVSSCYLQDWLLISWMILCKVFVEPYLQIACLIETYHLIVDLKVAYFAIAVLVPSDGFAKDV